MTTRQQLLRPLMLAALIAIVPALAACGSEATTATGTGTLTVHSVPQATVTIDGKEMGTTPLENIELSPGSHKITLASEGFKPIEEQVSLVKGENSKVEHFLALASVDDDRIATVAKELGIETEPFEAPSTHRGGSDIVFTQYWPIGKVRRAALNSFRIDVGESYGDDVPLATLVFKKGKKVLHEIEEFDPATPITIADMPKEVLDELKPGSSFTWGLRFEGRKHRKLSDDVKVTLASKAEEKKIEKSLDKMERRKSFQRQDPIVQETLRAQTLQNKRHYTEALLSYISILQSNPGVTSPYRGVVTTLRRLDRDKSEMFQVASQFVGGKGGHSGRASARPDAAGAPTGGPGKAAMAMLAGPRPAPNPTAGGNDTGPGNAGVTDMDSMQRNSDQADRDQAARNNRNDGPAAGQGDQGEQAGGQRNDGGQVNQGGANNNGPARNDPATNDGQNPSGGPAAGNQGGGADNPRDALEAARRETQALREALREASQGNNATPAQVQALHQALQDSQAALQQMEQTADRAQAGDQQAQEAFNQAQQNHQNAQQAGQNAMPQPGQDPNAPAGQTPQRPTTMEEALQAMAQAGNAPPNASELYGALRVAREAQEAADQANQTVETTRQAEREAEAAVRDLPPHATTAERNAASQAYRDAVTARENAEAAATTANLTAEQAQQRAQQAVERYPDAADRARELLRGN